MRKPEFPFLDEDIDVRPQELKMAASLIETMTEDFEPEQFKDAYREALEAVVRAKVEGNDVVRPAGVAAPEPKGQPADLTEILRASVSALKAERDTDGKDGKPAKPSSRAKTPAKTRPASRAKAEEAEAAPRAKAAARRKASA